MNILIVDEESAVHTLVRETFPRAECESVYEGHSALIALSRRAYDVILLDAAAPELDVSSFVSIVHGTPSLVNVRLVVMGPATAKPDGIVVINKPLQKPELRRAVTPPPTSERTVLLVEDNPDNQKLLIIQIAKLGYKPTAVSGGEEAIHEALTGKYGAVLMDLHLPQIDGYEASRRIRAVETTTHLPIIAITAGTTVDDRDRALAAGLDDYLTKPVTVDRMRRTLDRWILGEGGSEPPAPQAPLGPPPLAEDMLELFITTASDLLGKMRRAVADGNLPQVQRTAHQLAASGAYLGASTFAKLAKEIESLASQNVPVEEKVRQLEDEYTIHVRPRL
ncbi:MAG TPA: response regulator, partial [Aggregatilineales bacterium]|nr:response regulator [Aggregatilineales bacterium]